VDREAMSAGGKDSEAEAFDFSIAVVSLVVTTTKIGNLHFFNQPNPNRGVPYAPQLKKCIICGHKQNSHFQLECQHLFN